MGRQHKKITGLPDSRTRAHAVLKISDNLMPKISPMTEFQIKHIREAIF